MVLFIKGILGPLEYSGNPLEFLWKKNGRKNQTKARQEWSERHNKNDMECGKFK